MPSGTRPMQLCSGSKFVPRTRGSTSSRNWLIRSCARRSVARISIVPSPPPLLDCSVEFFTNDRVVNRIEPIAFFCLFCELGIATRPNVPIQPSAPGFVPLMLARELFARDDDIPQHGSFFDLVGWIHSVINPT